MIKKRITAIFLVLLILAGSFCITGCSTMDEDDTPMPWGRPQDWESDIPGMPQG